MWHSEWVILCTLIQKSTNQSCLNNNRKPNFKSNLYISTQEVAGVMLISRNETKHWGSLTVSLPHQLLQKGFSFYFIWYISYITLNSTQSYLCLATFSRGMYQTVAFTKDQTLIDIILCVCMLASSAAPFTWFTDLTFYAQIRVYYLRWKSYIHIQHGEFKVKVVELSEQWVCFLA